MFVSFNGTEMAFYELMCCPETTNSLTIDKAIETVTIA